MSPPASRLSELAEADRSARQGEVLEAVMGGRGRLPTPYKVWIHSPELAARLHPLGAFFSRDLSLSKREQEIGVLFAAKRWDADYVFEMHAREAREAGLPDYAIAALRDGQAPALPDPREAAVYDLMAALAQPGSPSDEVFAEATGRLGRDGVAELLALCGYFTAVALAMKLHAIQPPPG